MSKTFPYAYIRKKMTPIAKAQVPIMCKAVQYGLGVFSGIRGHWNAKDKNLYLFRPEDHFRRLEEAAKITGMKLNLSYPKFLEIITKLIKKNKAKEDVYLRPTLYAASTKLTPRFDNTDDDLAIYMISLKDYFSSSDGLNVCVSSWRRFDDDAISSKAKITGAYCNSALAKTEAINNGYDEAIFLNRDGNVCEASGANIFGIKNGEVWTPPLSANNLNGITRRSIIELFKNEHDLKVREENFDRSMLYTFDELFFTGTAAKVTAITSVDQRKIGTGKAGKTTKKLINIFTKITNGELEEYKKWLTPIY
ncbi:branched-chain amino acid transaminase [Candidatus Peregrinibacteria bacterium]|nr:branched-chain amino acid transaminase [Candidatus Peregrinibacteria bacterium]